MTGRDESSAFVDYLLIVDVPGHLVQNDWPFLLQADNILMVSPDRDEVKICDFGFSQEIDPSRNQYSVFGTPEFVAPEIIHQEPVTTKTDIWYIWCINANV